MHSYKNLNGIFYRGRNYFGEESVDKLMQSIKDPEVSKQIWDKWSQMVGGLGPQFQEVMQILSKDDRGIGKCFFGLPFFLELSE